jgi:hypothetical protein
MMWWILSTMAAVIVIGARRIDQSLARYAQQCASEWRPAPMTMIPITFDFGGAKPSPQRALLALVALCVILAMARWHYPDGLAGIACVPAACMMAAARMEEHRHRKRGLAFLWAVGFQISAIVTAPFVSRAGFVSSIAGCTLGITSGLDLLIIAALIGDAVIASILGTLAEAAWQFHDGFGSLAAGAACALRPLLGYPLRWNRCLRRGCCWALRLMRADGWRRRSPFG